MSTTKSLAASLAIALLMLACGGAVSPTSRVTLAPPRDVATPVDEVKVTPGVHEAEAADVCPAEFLEPCTEMYDATVESGTRSSSMPAAASHTARHTVSDCVAVRM